MMATSIERSRFDFARSYVRWHFPASCALLLALSLVAFWDNLVSDVGQPSNANPVMVVHGLFLLAWMILLVIQSVLPRLGKLTLHRRLGNYGIVIGIGVALSTFFLFVSVWRGWAAVSPEMLANRLFLPLYAAWIFGAWRTRRVQPEWHKRFIYTGTLFLLEPVLARTYDPLVAPLMPVYPPGADDHLFYGYMVVAWSAFYLALLFYDWLKNRHLHWLTIASLAITYAVYAVAFAFAPS